MDLWRLIKTVLSFFTVSLVVPCCLLVPSPIPQPRRLIPIMDGLSALSVASSVAQLVDFGCSVVSKTREIYKSEHGASVGNVEAAIATKRLLELSERLKTSLQGQEARGNPPALNAWSLGGPLLTTPSLYSLIDEIVAKAPPAIGIELRETFQDRRRIKAANIRKFAPVSQPTRKRRAHSFKESTAQTGRYVSIWWTMIVMTMAPNLLLP